MSVLIIVSAADFFLLSLISDWRRSSHSLNIVGPFGKGLLGSL